jgi:hypothetical protein
MAIPFIPVAIPFIPVVIFRADRQTTPSEGAIFRHRGTTMDKCRLRVRIGDVEFEAEGQPDVVLAQFQAFQAHLPKAPGDSGVVSAIPAVSAPNTAIDAPPDPAALDAALANILKVEHRVVSLTAGRLPVDDAVLLVLYGQRVALKNEAVTGAELVRGLLSTGVTLGRSDRLFATLASRGDIVSSGRGRRKRYRLTNAGLINARDRAAALLQHAVA